MTPFANNLRRLRLQSGLSQGQLALKAGIRRFTVSNLERGVRAPSWAMVQKLADALGVPCEDFRQTNHA